MKEQKRYIEHDDLAGATHLQISVYYSKGGRGMFSSSTIPRGYYLSVRPVAKRNGMVSYNLFQEGIHRHHHAYREIYADNIRSRSGVGA